MNQKTKKILSYVLPPVIVIGFIAFFARRASKATSGTGGISAAPDNIPLQTLPSTSTSGAGSVYPLKRGSTGEKVKELQRIIGATADGAFGPNTEAKLYEVAGVKQVNSDEEFEQVKKKAYGITTMSRAMDLLNKFKTGQYSILGVKQHKAIQVIKDAFGAYNSTGKYITIYPSTLYSKNDYSIVDTTKLGNVVVYVNKGNLLGYYLVDANAITLK